MEIILFHRAAVKIKQEMWESSNIGLAHGTLISSLPSFHHS